MKLKKFIKVFDIRTNVEIRKFDNELYNGNVYNIPKRLLDYRLDPCEDVFVEIQYSSTYKMCPIVVIPIE